MTPERRADCGSGEVLGPSGLTYRYHATNGKTNARFPLIAAIRLPTQSPTRTTRPTPTHSPTALRLQFARPKPPGRRRFGRSPPRSMVAALGRRGAESGKRRQWRTCFGGSGERSGGCSADRRGITSEDLWRSLGRAAGRFRKGRAAFHAEFGCCGRHNRSNVTWCFGFESISVFSHAAHEKRQSA
jgi:hypothetical protein